MHTDRLPDIQHLTPLTYATMTTSNERIARLLVEHGADPNEANRHISNARAKALVGWW
jgi:hypothetical protein